MPKPRSLARIIHECRREAAETEAVYITHPPQARQDAPLPVRFSEVRATQADLQSVEEPEREKPRRARGSAAVVGIHEYSGLVPTSPGLGILSAPRHVAVWLVCLLLAGMMWGCNVTQQISTTPRTPMEQLLLTQSLQRSLEDIAVRIPIGESITIEVAGVTADREFAQAVVTEWFRGHGVSVVAPLPPTCRLGPDMIVFCGNPVVPEYSVHLVLHSLGTERSDTFFGVPPIRSLLLPIATPELTLYSAIRQRGYSRFSLGIFHSPTGKPISNAVGEAVVSFSRYTVLFLFTFESTDLMPPPL